MSARMLGITHDDPTHSQLMSGGEVGFFSCDGVMMAEDNQGVTYQEVAKQADRLFEENGKDYVISSENHPDLVAGFAKEILADLEDNND